LNKFKDPDMTKKAQDLKSCFQSGAFRFQISNIKYARCPGNLSTQSISYLLGLFFTYDKFGILPEKGSYLEQTFKTMEIVGIIESVVSDNRKKAREKQERSLKRKK